MAKDKRFLYGKVTVTAVKVVMNCIGGFVCWWKWDKIKVKRYGYARSLPHKPVETTAT